ncbi:MAG: bifunctional precorrin-2 dehydrogenase/sirohydrochlorin ferrochelatase [Desulfovermiculus sp.]
MPYFPAFLDLRGRPCLVVGAGRVGRRKMQRLMHCQASPLIVVEPAPDNGLTSDPEMSRAITLHKRAFQSSDVQGAFLVVASTSNPEVNSHIGNLCHEKNILCNVVDQPELCSLVWPSLVNRGDLALAVTTGGASPALTRRIRQQLERQFGPEYATWLKLLKMLRPALIALGSPQRENSSVFRSLTDDSVLEAIIRNEGPELLALLQDRLPPDLHPFAREVLHELEFSL